MSATPSCPLCGGRTVFDGNFWHCANQDRPGPGCGVFDCLDVRPGQRFEHARYIQGSPKAGTARPDICTVTRVTSDTVYYKTETGMKVKTERARFADSVKGFID